MEHWKITDAYINKFRAQAEDIKRKAEREFYKKMRLIQILEEHKGEDYNFYEIWMEGYLCTEPKDAELPYFLACMPGTDFYDACCNYNRVMTDSTATEPYVTLNPDTRTASIWFRRLFDNRVNINNEL